MRTMTMQIRFTPVRFGAGDGVAGRLADALERAEQGDYMDRDEVGFLLGMMPKDALRMDEFLKGKPRLSLMASEGTPEPALPQFLLVCSRLRNSQLLVGEVADLLIRMLRP